MHIIDFKTRKTGLLLALLLGGLLGSEGFSLTVNPSDSAKIAQLLQEGHRRLESRQVGLARNSFELVLNINRENLQAQLGMGRVELAIEDWTAADGWFKKVLKKDPDQVEALYGFAICKREIGVNKVLLERKLIWDSAIKHFQRAMAVDSSFRDLIYQYALLQRYRGRYFEAVELGHRQLAVNPEFSMMRYNICHLYDYALSNESPRDVEAWLLSNKNPYHRYFVGDLYRREGVYDKAKSVLEAALDNPGDMPVQPILLSLVRLYTVTQADQKAHDTYWKAVELMDDPVQSQFVLEDIMPIVNDPEYDFFKHDPAMNDLKRVLRQFWRRRDPLPAASYNYRLVEHYRRLVTAEKDYRYDGFRHTLDRGDRMQILQFPRSYAENWKFNDIGLVYIRYGEPDDKALALTADQGDTRYQKTLNSNQSWLYQPRPQHPKMIFHFMISKNAPPGFWTLVPGFTNISIIERMAHWDSRYQQIISAYRNIQGGANSMNRVEMVQHAEMQQIYTDRSKTVDRAFQYDRHTWPKETKTLAMHYDTYRFRDGDNKDLMQLAYAIEADDILKEQSGRDSVHFEAGLVIMDENLNPLFKETREFALLNDRDPRIHHQFFIDEFSVPVDLMKQNIAFHAKITGRNKLNGWRFPLSLPDKNRHALDVSSLKLAYQVERDSETGHYSILPNPSGLFGKKQSLFAYYEVYNLEKDESGQTDFKVSFALRQKTKKRGLIKRIFGSSKLYQVTLENERTSKENQIKDFISFDLSKASPGEYELELIIHDRHAGKTANSVSVFALE